MTTIAAQVAWQRGSQKFTDNRYSRAHVWKFDGGYCVPASSSPDVVPIPLSDPAAVDPEEAFVAAISSCHMLWFLSIAAKRGLTIESYVDNAVGHLAENSEGKLAIVTVELHPRVVWLDVRDPTREILRQLHHLAHEQCFIANSVKTEIKVCT